MLRAVLLPLTLLVLAAATVRAAGVCTSGTPLEVQTGLWGVSGATLESRTEAPSGTNLLVVSHVYMRGGWRQ
jgi:hypothetical protein